MTSPEIRHATPDDVSRTAELIAVSFSALDAAVWLVPDPGERTKILAGDFALYVEHAMTHGDAHLIEDAGALVAAAVWFPQPSHPTPEPDGYDERLMAVCGQYVDRFRTLDQLFDDHHPRIYPHHHLAYLAVRPDRQGEGLGTALLDHHHDRLDRHEMPAFLQASSHRSRVLYERHGYERLGEPFHLPYGPPFWSMWREPEAQGRSDQPVV